MRLTMRPPMRPPKTLQTSYLLQQFLQQQAEDSVCLNDLLNFLGDRAFGPLLLFCALPEALPLPVVGISAVIALPLMLVSAQLVLGFHKPWLPRWLSQRPVQRQRVEQLIGQFLKYLHRFEHWIQPRWRVLTRPLMLRFLGLLVFLLGIVIALPIPFGNFLPATAALIISLGLIEQDGLMIIIGSLLAITILVIMSGAILTLLSLLQLNHS